MSIFLKIMGSMEEITETLDDFAELAKEADKDKDGKLEFEDVKRWLDDPTMAFTAVKVFNGILSIWRKLQ